MRRSFLLTAVAVVFFAGLIWLLMRQDHVLKTGTGCMDYLHFNRADAVQAKVIMDSWRGEQVKTNAVKWIVRLDYLLIIVYVSYLYWALVRRKKTVRQVPDQRWQVGWLTAAIVCILAGAVLDVIQDTIIYIYVSVPKGRVHSLEILTWCKWRALLTGVLILIGSWIPLGWVRKIPIRPFFEYLRAVLKSIWLFFPSLLFLLLTIVAFWKQSQGKDIVVAFTEADRSGFRLVFFLVIAFWVYISWYSSRVIAEIKVKDERIKERFLYNYPRLAGNACLLVAELALLQAPILEHPLCPGLATGILAVALIGLYLADRWIGRQMKKLADALGKGAGWLFIVFVAILPGGKFIPFSHVGYIYGLLAMLLLLHFLYLFYVNLRRDRLPANQKTYLTIKQASGFSQTILAFFCIPNEEISYVRWLIRISLLAIGVDIIAILNLPIARGIGPFSLVILAFAVLLAFGNVITALSVRLRLNIHFLLFLMALLLGLPERHNVKQLELTQKHNGYSHRPSLRQYLKTWLQRVPDSASSYDMYLVLANGGASRSGYWTASVLGRLEDTSRLRCPQDPFSRHLFCLSGTSGGGVGVATFFALLNDHRKPTDSSYCESAQVFLQQDYFSYTLARMLGPDFFNYIFHLTSSKDRGRALEEAFEEYSDTVHYQPEFNQAFSEFPAMNADSNKVLLPILFVNTTQMQDGTPGVVTNLRLDTTYFNQRIDVMDLLDSTRDISMASGAILGARFPYLSPAGRIGNHYFVDGGYFDNSGAGVVQELLRGMLTIAWDDSLRGDTWIYRRVKRLHIKVLHIVNSPVNGTDTLHAVAPIKNDLLSPILTIVGAYDMQTTVNDDRLYHYINDIDKYFGIRAEHRLISLYKDSSESKIKEDPYSMNWFISDTTRHRIDERLAHQPMIDTILRQSGFFPCINEGKNVSRY